MVWKSGVFHLCMGTLFEPLQAANALRCLTGATINQLRKVLGETVSTDYAEPIAAPVLLAGRRLVHRLRWSGRIAKSRGRQR